MSDYNRKLYKKKRKKSDKEPVLEWVGAAIGIGRAALPWIVRGLSTYATVSTVKSAIFGSGSESSENTPTSSAIPGGDTKKNIFQSLFGAFYGKKGTIKYGDASVFIFTIDDPTYIIENIKSRGKMYGLYKRLLEKIFSKEQISGADVLAFESTSTMQRSGLPIVPKSVRFYKILKRMNCMYFFYADKCYFIFVDKTKTGVRGLIRSVYNSVLGDLGSKNNQSNAASVFNAQEQNQSSLINKILSYSGPSASDKIDIVSNILGDKSTGLFSSISGVLGSSKASDNNKVSEIMSLVNNKKQDSNQKPKVMQLTDEMIDNIEFPTY